jgi:hypothetical protein
VARERAKAEKLAKYNAKKAKLAADKAAAPAEPKEKKEKKKVEPAPEFVYLEETPKGEKKSMLAILDCCALFILGLRLTALFRSPEIARRPRLQVIQPCCRRIGMVRLVGEGGLL